MTLLIPLDEAEIVRLYKEEKYTLKKICLTLHIIPGGSNHKKIKRILWAHGIKPVYRNPSDYDLRRRKPWKDQNLTKLKGFRLQNYIKNQEWRRKLSESVKKTKALMKNGIIKPTIN